MNKREAPGFMRKPDAFFLHKWAFIFLKGQSGYFQKDQLILIQNDFRIEEQNISAVGQNS